MCEISINIWVYIAFDIFCQIFPMFIGSGAKRDRKKQFTYQELRPTYTQEALARLIELGYIKHIISQNCDGLHRLSGVPHERYVKNKNHASYGKLAHVFMAVTCGNCWIRLYSNCGLVFFLIPLKGHSHAIWDKN